MGEDYKFKKVIETITFEMQDNFLNSNFVRKNIKYLTELSSNPLSNVQNRGNFCAIQKYPKIVIFLCSRLRRSQSGFNGIEGPPALRIAICRSLISWVLMNLSIKRFGDNISSRSKSRKDCAFAKDGAVDRRRYACDESWG